MLNNFKSILKQHAHACMFIGTVLVSLNAPAMQIGKIGDKNGRWTVKTPETTIETMPGPDRKATSV